MLRCSWHIWAHFVVLCSALICALCCSSGWKSEKYANQYILSTAIHRNVTSRIEKHSRKEFAASPLKHLKEEKNHHFNLSRKVIGHFSHAWYAKREREKNWINVRRNAINQKKQRYLLRTVDTFTFEWMDWRFEVYWTVWKSRWKQKILERCIHFNFNFKLWTDTALRANTWLADVMYKLNRKLMANNKFTCQSIHQLNRCDVGKVSKCVSSLQ